MVAWEMGGTSAIRIPIAVNTFVLDGGGRCTTWQFDRDHRYGPRVAIGIALLIGSSVGGRVGSVRRV